MSRRLGPGTSRAVTALCGAALVLPVFGEVAAARADAAPPVFCPPGLRERGAHERDCWPRECADDEACGSGAACRSVTRCIRIREIHEGDSMDTVPRDVDEGPCTAAGGCVGEGASCRALRRCEPTRPTPSFVDGRWTGAPYEAPTGCAARATGSGSANLLLAAALAAVALARRGRRAISAEPPRERRRQPATTTARAATSDTARWASAGSAQPPVR